MLNISNKFLESTFNGEPIVGVHIRRTDKLLFESKFIPLEHYMNSVDEYFDQLQLTQKITKRRIYLASEEPKVFEEMQQKYPHYEINANENVEIPNLSMRYTKSALRQMVTDIEMLSRCDYVVCTFSSNICRLILEYFQTKHIDATFKVKNLDSHYTTMYLTGPRGVAIMNHKAAQLPNTTEIDLQIGDDLYLYSSFYRNGEFSAYNNRAFKSGLVPSFKVEILNEYYRGVKNFSFN